MSRPVLLLVCVAALAVPVTAAAPAGAARRCPQKALCRTPSRADSRVVVRNLLGAVDSAALRRALGLPALGPAAERALARADRRFAARTPHSRPTPGRRRRVARQASAALGDAVDLADGVALPGGGRMRRHLKLATHSDPCPRAGADAGRVTGHGEYRLESTATQPDGDVVRVTSVTVSLQAEWSADTDATGAVGGSTAERSTGVDIDVDAYALNPATKARSEERQDTIHIDWQTGGGGGGGDVVGPPTGPAVGPLVNQELFNQTADALIEAAYDSADRGFHVAERNWQRSNRCAKVVLYPSTQTLKPGARVTVVAHPQDAFGGPVKLGALRAKASPGASVRPARVSGRRIDGARFTFVAPRRKWPRSRPPWMQVSMSSVAGRADQRLTFHDAVGYHIESVNVTEHFHVASLPSRYASDVVFSIDRQEVVQGAFDVAGAKTQRLPGGVTMLSVPPVAHRSTTTGSAHQFQHEVTCNGSETERQPFSILLTPKGSTVEVGLNGLLPPFSLICGHMGAEPYVGEPLVTPRGGLIVRVPKSAFDGGDVVVPVDFTVDGLESDFGPTSGQDAALTESWHGSVTLAAGGG